MKKNFQLANPCIPLVKIILGRFKSEQIMSLELNSNRPWLKNDLIIVNNIISLILLNLPHDTKINQYQKYVVQCFSFISSSHDKKYDTGYELILLMNRDEDFQRPTMPAHIWSQTNFVIGGKGQMVSREGGTWLSFHTAPGKIGVIINISSVVVEKRNPNALKRGFIVPDYVNNPEMDLEAYTK